MSLDKVSWGSGRVTAFRDWLHNELENTEGDRAPLIQKWKDLIEKHRSRVIGDGIASEPFEGASDLEYPLTSIHFEPVYADLMQTLHIPPDFWGVTPGRPDAVEVAKPLQEFLGIIERNYIKMKEVNSTALVDDVILGTVVYKDDIHHLAKRVKDYDDQGNIVKRTKTTFQPRVKHVPLERFWIPANSIRINPDEDYGATWVAEEFYLTPGQLKDRAEGSSPFAPNYDKKAYERVLHFENEHRADEIDEKKQAEQEYIPFETRPIRLFEVWARFDVDGDGFEEDVVVIWHQEAREILRALYNPFLHGQRPYDSAAYVPSFGFYGVGVAEADEWAQIAMTRLLNSALDSALISNSMMYRVPLGTQVGPDSSIYPGRFWYMGPEEKFEAIPMGQPNATIYHLMDRFSQWAESRTGVSELRQGNVTNLPDRTPASTIMSVMQEGNKKFDMILSNIRRPMNRIGARVLQNLVQISKSDPRFKALAIQALGMKDGEKVVKVLSGPIHDIEDKFGVAVSASSSQVNKEVQKQSYTALAQIMAQFYPSMLQYAQGIAQFTQDPTPVVSTMQAAFRGQTELLRRIVEAYDIQNPDEFIPDVGAQASAAAPTAGPAGAPGAPQGAPAASPEVAPLGGPAGPSPGSPDILSAFLGLG
jgi:hypothetical protein